MLKIQAITSKNISFVPCFNIKIKLESKLYFSMLKHIAFHITIKTEELKENLRTANSNLFIPKTTLSLGSGHLHIKSLDCCYFNGQGWANGNLLITIRWDEKKTCTL